MAHQPRSAGTRRIGIFNRSYYEEVLIARVHPEIFRSEAIPDTPHHDKKIWHDRYPSIVTQKLHKFFIHQRSGSGLFEIHDVFGKIKRGTKCRAKNLNPITFPPV